MPRRRATLRGHREVPGPWVGRKSLCGPDLGKLWIRQQSAGLIQQDAVAAAAEWGLNQLIHESLDRNLEVEDPGVFPVVKDDRRRGPDHPAVRVR